jgi:tetraacyldisaccharide 4'-kinase
MPEIILDQRSRLTRRTQDLWRSWERRTPFWLRLIAGLTDPLYTRLLNNRISGRLQPTDGPLIVSVGNLLSGGAGKTPVVIKLAGELSALEMSGAILTRGYGSALKGPIVVDPDDPTCADEARLMAAKLPQWTVMQSRDRLQGLHSLQKRNPAPQVVILEDGFQTAQVPRHLDILLVDKCRLQDGVVEAQTGKLLPWGPYRESAAGASRAAVWIIKADADLPPGVGGDKGARVLQQTRHMAAPPAVEHYDGAYGLISGIAVPENFETGCAGLMGRPPTVTARFDDHAAYTPETLREVLQQARRHDVRCWLTTAKDYVKLQAVWPETIQLYCVELQLSWTGEQTLAQIVLKETERWHRE